MAGYQPDPDQNLGQLYAGDFVIVGSTSMRWNSYGNPGNDLRVSFTLPNSNRNGNIKISSCSQSTEFDTILWLLDSSGRLVWYNDDSPCTLSTNSTQSFLSLNVKAKWGWGTLMAGKSYTIVVDGFSEGQTLTLNPNRNPQP